MKLLNIETPVTRNFIPQILLNVQDFYFHKVGYTSYDEAIFGPQTEFTKHFFHGTRLGGESPPSDWRLGEPQDKTQLQLFATTLLSVQKSVLIFL
jgi:hypothetical protein